MVLKQGYKQAEVGMIPEDWDDVPLGDLGQIVRGGSPRPAGDTRYFDGDFIPWLTVASLTNIPAEQQYIFDTKTKLTREGSKRSRTLRSGTISIVNSGARTLGVSKILMIDACANDGIAALIGQTAGNKEFICYYLNSIIYNLREVVASGNDQLNLNTTRIAKIRLPFPPEQEQRSIAAVLSDVDAALAGVLRLIAKKRDLKQAAMQTLISGQTRLPGFSAEWQVIRLGEVGTCLRGVTYNGDLDLRQHDTFETVRLLRSSNVQNGMVVLDELQFVRRQRVTEKQILRTKDIVICMANGSKSLVGKAGFFQVDDGQPYTFGAFMGCFRTNNDRADPDYVLNLFKTHHYAEYIKLLLAGSTINNLSPKAIEGLEFTLPPKLEQTAIAAVLSDMDAEIAALAAQADKNRRLKQAMLQALLTGRTRLALPEVAHA